MMPLLSKSTFIRSLQCQKSLYLYKKFYHLRDEISQERQYVFERGHDVGRFAQQLFPGGVDVGWNSPKEYELSVSRTNQCISDGTNVIYEAAFVWNNVLVAVDIFVKEKTGWRIYEVKSSLGISETYLRDAALQLYIATKSGLHVNGISIIHLDKNYIRQEELKPDQLFIVEDVTSLSEERMNDIVFGLIDARTTLSQNFIPDIKTGPHCDSPYTCDFKGYCGLNKMSTNSIFQWDDLEQEQKWNLFKSNVFDFRDIPDEYPLNPRQKIALKSRKTGEVYIDDESIKNQLDRITAPVAFLDIQIFRPAVPLTLGTHPYQQVPFGYALKNNEDGDTKVNLSNADFDFEEDFLKQFLADTSIYKTIICFDKQRQLSALKKITERYPQYKGETEMCLESLIDLSDIFKNRDFYHPEMKKNLRDLPSVFGLEIKQSKEDKIKSDSLAGTAFEQLYKAGDLMHDIEIKEMLKSYMQGNLEAVELVFKGLFMIK